MKNCKLPTLLAIIGLVCTLVALPFLVACGQGGPTPTKPITLKFSTGWGPNVTAVIACESVLKDIEETTGGRVVIERYFGGALGKGDAQHDIVLQGIADISGARQSYTPGVFPLTSVLELPLLPIATAEEGTRILFDLYEKFPELRAEYDDTKVLFIAIMSPTWLHTIDKPVHGPDDIKGLKLRSSGEVETEMIKLLGATPVGLTAGDLYTSLDKGIVEGVAWTVQGIPGWKLNEVLKYTTKTAFFVNPFFLLINKDSWNALPGDIQDIIEDVTGRNGAVKAVRAAYDSRLDSALQTILDAGMVVYEPSDAEVAELQKVVTPMYDRWAEKMEAKGLPGRAILDEAMRLAKEYK
ncbi:TRAP transporter substrate-binding protein [Chloroflexota bacterium]